jgi:hypothetical protein
MNIAASLPAPLDTFVVDLPAGQYYDFELPPDSPYPVKGVIYPVDCGHIQGYNGKQKKHELNLLVGNTADGEVGCIEVNRGPDVEAEHTFYVALSKEEISQIAEALELSMVSHTAYKDIPGLVEQIEKFKNQ